MSSIWHQEEYTSQLVIGSGGAIILFLLLVAVFTSAFFVYLIVATFIVLLILMFYSCRVECDAEDIVVTYGIGFLERRIPIFGIATATPVANESIATFPFSPKAQLAVMVVLRNGRKFRFPATRPKELAEALMTRAYRG